jgi:hypothetical protein
MLILETKVPTQENWEPTHSDGVITMVLSDVSTSTTHFIDLYGEGTYGMSMRFEDRETAKLAWQEIIQKSSVSKSHLKEMGFEEY